MKDKIKHLLYISENLLFVIFIINIFFLTINTTADMIINKKGDTLSGTIVKETETSIIIKTAQFGEISVPRSQVKEIQRQDPNEVEGDILFAERKYNDALEKYKVALQTTDNKERIDEKINDVLLKIEEVSSSTFRERNASVLQYIKDRKYDKALEILYNILENSKDESLKTAVKKQIAEVYYLKSQEWLNVVRPNDAEKELLRAVDVYPDDYKSHLLLGKIYAERNPLAANGVDELKKGISIAEKTLKEDELLEHRFRLAELLYAQLKYEEAITQYLILLKIAPQKYPTSLDRTVDSYIKLSDGYNKNFDYAKTVDNLKAALNLNPSSRQAYNLLGTIYKNNREYKKAIEEFKASLNIDNKQLDINYLTGLCYLSLFDNANAKDYLARETAVNPFHYNAYCSLAEIYKNEGDYDKSLEYLSKAVEKDKDKYKAYYLLGEIYFILHKYDLAKTNLLKTLEIKNDSIKPKILLNRMYINENKFDQALVYMKEVRDSLLQNKNAGQVLTDEDKEYLAEAYTNIAFINMIKENNYSAIGDLDTALKYKPNYPDAYNIKGRVYERLKDYKKAEDNFLKAIELNPKEPDYHLYLGLLYLRNLKLVDKAQEHFKHYILLGGSEVAKVNKWIQECGGSPIDPPDNGNKEKNE